MSWSWRNCCIIKWQKKRLLWDDSLYPYVFSCLETNDSNQDKSFNPSTKRFLLIFFSDNNDLELQAILDQKIIDSFLLISPNFVEETGLFRVLALDVICSIRRCHRFSNLYILNISIFSSQANFFLLELHTTLFYNLLIV